MLRLAIDQSFNADIIRGLLRRRTDIDLVRVQDAGLTGAVDPSVLTWAAAERRVLLSHDRKTMSHFAWRRVQTGEPMSGVVIVSAVLGSERLSTNYFSS